VSIGSFQALQHRMVDMMISYEQARSMSYLACVKIDNADADERRGSSPRQDQDRRRLPAREPGIRPAPRGMASTEELKISHIFRRLTCSPDLRRRRAPLGASRALRDSSR